MSKLKLTVIFDYDEMSMHGGDGDLQAKEWFYDILRGRYDNRLAVWESEIGDHIGDIKVIDISEIDSVLEASE